MRKSLKSTSAVVAGGSLAVLGLAGAAYAASLQLQSNNLGAGSATVAACAGSAASAMNAKWSVGLDGVEDTANGFVVRKLDIENVPASCTGRTLYISTNGVVAPATTASVLGSGSASIGTFTTGQLVKTVQVTLTPAAGSTGVQAKDLTGMNILIPN